MCGIAGWVDYSGVKNGGETVLAMAKTLIPRGPDDEGLYCSDNCVLAHRRLAIIDPENGRQPMTVKYHGKKYTIVYNGELYNTKEVHSELVSLGISFRTSSDTEVLLNAYAVWGESCLDKLNGIFAFAVWNESDRQLFLARDRMGVKPLYYYEYSGGIIFASEIKALLTHPMIKPVADRESIAQIMLLGPARIPGTGVFKDIKELSMSQCGMFTEYGLKKRSYWSVCASPHTESFEETKEHLAFLVKDAIKRQLVSDVGVCTFLSGGLDSSIISAVAAKEFSRQGKTLRTYSIDYVDNDKNFRASSFQPDADAPWVKVMADYIKSDHVNIELDTPALTDALADCTYATDLPGMADVDSSLYLFCKEIRKDYKVALSGECSDEIFGGYPWFHNEEILFRKGFPWARSTRERCGLLKEGIISESDAFDYVEGECEKTTALTDVLDSDTPKERRMREMFMLNIHWFMQTLLTRKDRQSMAWGLEVRVPLCDHRIVRYAYNIPWEMKAYNGREKGILRSAMEGVLPDDVLWRKKSPYPKTHNPTYLAEVVRRMKNVLTDKDCRLTEIVDRDKLTALCDDPSLFKGNWYGQLMTAPQTFAYLLQTEAWLRHYNVEIRL